MRIAMNWEWQNSLDVIVRFDEGIGEVLRLLARHGHDVTLVTWGGPAYGTDSGVHFLLIPPGQQDQWVQSVVDLKPDLLLSWGSIDHRVAVACKKATNAPLYMFLAGGGIDHPHRDLIDHFFVETQFHQDDLGAGRATKALGVMTDVLTPNPNQPRLWDVFLPASFTVNKRYSLFADVIELGKLRGVSVGPHNDEGCVIECEKVYAATFGYVSRRVLRDFYCASQVTVLTGGAWGGSQRTLLESLACGVPVVACDDNFQLDWLRNLGAPVTWCPPQADLLLADIRSVMANPPDPALLRQFVLDHFTAQHYFDAVLNVVAPTHAAV